MSKFLLVLMMLFSLGGSNRLDIDFKELEVPSFKEFFTSARSTYDNDDIVGYLKIDGVMDSLVTQTTDNSYYLNHDIKKEKNKSGQVFMDYRNEKNDKITLIYGHNSYKNIPFVNLEKYYDKDFFNEHRYIDLTLENEKKSYEIFSVYVETDDWDYTKLKFDNDNEYLDHLEKLKSNSMFASDVQLDRDSEILILQTCSHLKEYKDYENKYLLVIGRRIEVNEEVEI